MLCVFAFTHPQSRLLSKRAFSFWAVAAMCGFGTEILVKVMKEAVYVSLSCIFALGGVIVGTVIGAMKGQTTETGFLRGAGIGAVTGGITAVQLVVSVAEGESLSKVVLLHSLLNGKAFIEWVAPLETIYREFSDIYDANKEAKGLSQRCIQKLPECKVHLSNFVQSCQQLCCSICLQDFQDGDSARELPSCEHFFHSDCIETWLTQNGSCPVCRTYICDDNYEF
ncbi:zf-RING_2 domain-containing protein [Cephalotus follicularis]|uniref:Zf-RING_2 domain-containing protein n=1 Tax=Cephalotus follicularis TaxID=3775 RepID=A0A1Q3BY26_CEPFO|nr:zf-RING_2 domain-containing protein [Cephalotus follicularis]